ncbi:MAG: NUDIX hydrolase N-terminal domain-containing protein, partial [Acidimicrobiia bacterium]|nr:NUDIX hydrolase N-terminal domain-containing protein [Acidimicrobiia bacterium]
MAEADDVVSGDRVDDRTTGEPAATTADLNRWSAALTAIAQTGLAFTDSTFEQERYQEILAISADIKTAVEHRLHPEDSPPIADDYVESWLRSVHPRVSGYVTPKVAVGAAVTDGEGRLLLIQRSDSGVWLYPTGWADVGYSAAEVAVKEVREETGITCEVVRPLAVIDGLRAGFSRVPLYSIVFLCRATGGDLSPHPLECLDVGWFGRHDLPSPLANFDLWGEHTFAALNGDDNGVLYDPPS